MVLSPLKKEKLILLDYKMGYKLKTHSGASKTFQKDWYICEK